MEKIVFIVDDNDANLTLAASILENEYRVLTMPSAEKMLMLLEKKIPDLILMDIEMPEMNGFEAIALLKENPKWKEIPVLFLTGWIDEKIKSDAEKAGAFDIVSKPITASVLQEYVKKYI